MLPVMVFSLCYLSVSFVIYLKSLRKVADEIWLDKSLNEVRIVYRNKGYRKFRGVGSEEILLTQALITPTDIYLKGVH